MKAMMAGLATMVVGAPGLAGGQGIERHKPPGTGPSLILQAVSVPAGSAMIYLSGQFASPINPAMDTLTTPNIADFGNTKTQTISALNKIKGILISHGYEMSDIIKMTVFVVGDPDHGGKMDFAGMNEGFKMFFGTADNPNTVARSTVQVAALAGPAFLVEIEVTAARTRTGVRGDRRVR